MSANPETLEPFGPIREKDWVEGWSPEFIDATGDRVEERRVIKTPAHLGHGEPHDA